MIVSMYSGNHSIDDIWRISGFKSRCSIFRILNKYGVDLNRGRIPFEIQSDKQASLSEGRRAFLSLRDMAEAGRFPEMSLDEINKEIELSRSGR